MKYFLTPALLALIVSCNTNVCREDFAFKEKFYNTVNVIELFQGGSPVRAMYRYQAVECLEAITKHKSMVGKDGDTPYFYDYNEDLIKDIKLWNNWYQDNKCQMTLVKADSLIAAHSEMNGELDWPADILVVEGDTLSY